ncbi:hypothetical protein QBC46DRAFT_392231 [Diplogelasinospora grovesii]|uniref:Uncharacterized protein n=1 Tax=Diplogelasinospora grovesii TaxID=303347 RepID=A0AAN6N3M1_9PEZI|nr:hypothetical protein QBC46DRAFT_392231 [Diplogelasinospora grovesii]
MPKARVLALPLTGTVSSSHLVSPAAGSNLPMLTCDGIFRWKASDVLPKCPRCAAGTAIPSISCQTGTFLPGACFSYAWTTNCSSIKTLSLTATAEWRRRPHLSLLLAVGLILGTIGCSSPRPCIETGPAGTWSCRHLAPSPTTY